MHDHPLGGVAGLAAVLQPPAHRGLDRAVQVVGAEQDERVGPAELEHDLLQVAAGHLGHGRTGALRAGQRHRLDARVGDDVGGLVVGGVDVDVGAVGEAGVTEDLLERLCRLGALRGVLEHDGVADDQVGAGEPGDLVVGVVPRHDPEQRPERAAPHHRGALALEELDRLLGHEPLGVVGVVLVDGGAEVDLAERVLVGLAHLPLDDLGELLTTLGVQLGALRTSSARSATVVRRAHVLCAWVASAIACWICSSVAVG